MAYFGSSVVKGYDGPKYTQSDVDTQKGDIANSQNTYNQYKQQADDAKNVYDDKFNSQTSYGDLINQGEEKYGVNDARNQYQQSKDAVNATINAMNTLPSSINANSNVVLTNSQRQAALGNQMGKYQNTLTDLSNQASSDLENYSQAVSQAQNFAGQSMSQEQYNINTALSRYQTEISNAQQQYQNLLNEKNYLNTMYGTMFDQYYKEEMMKLEEWADNLSAETQRYVAGLQKAASDNQVNVQKYLADLQAKQQQDTSFLGWLNSDNALNSGEWGEGMTTGDKISNLMTLSNNYQNALSSQNMNDLKNIYDGSTYQDYLNWRRAQ